MMAMTIVLWCFFALIDAFTLLQDPQTTDWTTTDNGSSETKQFTETLKSTAEIDEDLAILITTTSKTTQKSGEILVEDIKTDENYLPVNGTSDYLAELLSNFNASEFSLEDSETSFVTKSTVSILTGKGEANKEFDPETKAYEASAVTDELASTISVAMEGNEVDLNNSRLSVITETSETVTVTEKTSTNPEAVAEDMEKRFKTLFDRLLEFTRKYYFENGNQIPDLIRNRLRDILKFYDEDLSNEEDFLNK
ncbi:unnamed protein product [Hymenolepis diminuta]|uniref:Uncharacterized protein n=1 Tax=Hymenolepis diminuta TaxID=6216 RepID=A0A564YR13_HYMDI|nr:unnamed protein product [Hymenolepis diminuta]